MTVHGFMRSLVDRERLLLDAYLRGAHTMTSFTRRFKLDPYQELAVGISRLHSTGDGQRDERIATASLVYAMFHREFVRARRQLRRNDVDDVDVHEDAVYVRLRVGGRSFKVTRLSGQCEICTEVYGFTKRVEDTRVNVPALSDAEAHAHVTRAVDGFLAMVREDIAKRGA